MATVQAFFAAEINKLDLTIRQMQINLDPSANGRHAGMRALLDTKCRQRHLIEQLAAQSQDFETALNLCRRRMIAAEKAHAHIAARGGAHDLRCADAWWDTLGELQYLAALVNRLQAAHTHQQSS